MTPGYSIGPNVIRPWYMRCPQGDLQVCRDKEQATEQVHEFPVLAVARVNYLDHGLVVTVSQNTLVPPYVPPDNASQHDWEQFLAPGEDRWPEVLKPVASRPCSDHLVPAASMNRWWSGDPTQYDSCIETPFQCSRNVCHQARSDRKAAFSRIRGRRPRDPFRSSNIRRRKVLPGLTTLLAC